MTSVHGLGSAPPGAGAPGLARSPEVQWPHTRWTRIDFTGGPLPPTSRPAAGRRYPVPGLRRRRIHAVLRAHRPGATTSLLTAVLTCCAGGSGASRFDASRGADQASREMPPGDTELVWRPWFREATATAGFFSGFEGLQERRP